MEEGLKVGMKLAGLVVKLYIKAIQFVLVLAYNILWTWTFSHLFNAFAARFLERWQQARLFKTLNNRTTKKLVALLDESKLFEKSSEYDKLYPNFYRDKEDGKIYISILNSQKIEDFETYLRGFGEIFGHNFIELRHIDKNIYEMIEDSLPSLVKYDERPGEVGEGFWIGTDYKGESVSLNFLHTPAMLITGASGSGKSVLGRVLIEEATRGGYEVYIVDGKGGIDWMDAPCKALYTDFEEIAAHYEKILEEMNNRLKKLVDFRAKNWIEATAAGHEMSPMFCFMDESSDFFEIGSKSTDKNYAVKWRIVNAINELCRKSRAVGIYQAFSLQAAKADSVPNDVKNNAGFRVSYALPTAAMSQTLFESAIAFDPTLRHGKGVFKGVEGEPVVFRGAYVDA